MKSEIRIIKSKCRWIAMLLVALSVSAPVRAQQSTKRVLAFYSANVERDHVIFAEQAVKFFAATAKAHGFEFSSTTDWNDLNAEKLQGVQLILWLNDSPHTPSQRAAFESYMEHGGGWMGFHAAAYNDESTGWPWFVSFLGGAVFYGNNWPPLPALLDVDNPSSSVTRRIRPHFMAPANEWYIWQPSPRANPAVKVLVTLARSNYPIGLKDTIEGGDVPVVWSNTRYRMIYMNMGHGDKIFNSAEQNRLFEDALESLITDKR
ncbi:ThuA domain-containing protein [Occallatibacter riparius]|uniref:ThuA domain-containing protein n=1 Tax=Occallatibacter riparius TaxID=1002689 RepID=A0A9J7BRL7_9BACT|nr:ThuA domain-containing protein [Occallatibacter riparius]UWZ83693.1 ThuA domain-containing protein [Occallatibacter riparius]